MLRLFTAAKPHRHAITPLLLLCGFGALLIAGSAWAQGPEPPSDVLAYGGPRAVFVEWEPSPTHEVAGYHVYRTRSDAAGTPEEEDSRVRISTELVIINEFEDEGTEAGQHYIYQVAGVDDEAQVGLLSAPSEAVKANYLAMFLPDISAPIDRDSLFLWGDTAGSPELSGYVRIPVAFRSLYDVVAVGLDIVIELPNDLVEADTRDDVIVRPATTFRGAPFAYNIPEAGELRISSIDAQGRVLYGSGVLFEIFVRPRAAACPEPDNLFLVEDQFELEGTEGVRIYDDELNPVMLDLLSGRLCLVGEECLHGDVDGDGAVTEADVEAILGLRVGITEHDACSRWAGDINLDFRVDSADAALIARWLNGEPLNPPLDTETADAPSFAGYAAGAGPEVRVAHVSGAPGDVVRVPLTIDSGTEPLPLAGFAAVIAYPESLSLVAAVAGPSLPDDVLFSASETGGITRLSASSSESIGGTGRQYLAILTFSIAADAAPSGAYPVSLIGFEANDAYGFAPRHDAPGTPVWRKSGVLRSTLFVRVEDVASGEVVDSATAELSGLPYQPVAADTQGWHVFPFIDSGVYTVVVQAVGYASGSQSVRVPAGAAAAATLRLQRSSSVGGEPSREAEAVEGEPSREAEAVEGEEEEGEIKPPLLNCSGNTTGPHSPIHTGLIIAVVFMGLLVLGRRRMGTGDRDPEMGRGRGKKG